MSSTLEKLFTAIKKNELETVEIILKDNPSLINATDIDGHSAIHECSCTNNVEILEKLIKDYKADINARTEYDYTPLHIAAENIQFRIILELIKQGADLTLIDRGHCSFLDYIPKFTNPLFDYDMNWTDKSTILKRIAILMRDSEFRTNNAIPYEIAKDVYNEALNQVKKSGGDVSLITEIDSQL